MKVEQTLFKPSVFDRIVLFRYKIICSYRLNKNLVIFVCGSKKKCLYLKHSYFFSEGFHYYKIKYQDLDNYIKILLSAKKKIEEDNTRHE